MLKSVFKLSVIPSIALVLVASIQVFLGTQLGLTPWKGGGFGMFSTIDSTDARDIRVRISIDGEIIEIDPPPSLRKQVEKARAWPSKVNITRLGRKLLNQNWIPSDYTVLADYDLSGDLQIEDISSDAPKIRAAIPSELRYYDGEISLADTVILEVWQKRFDAELGTLSTRNLKVYEFNR